jgi:hypothetical protein
VHEKVVTKRNLGVFFLLSSTGRIE